MFFDTKTNWLHAAGAFAVVLTLPLALSCGDGSSKPLDDELPLIVPLPQPEIPEEVVDDYDETKILSYIKDVSYFDNIEASDPIDTKDHQFDRGTRCVKFDSDADYIYGYVEVNTTDREKHVDNKNLLNNLGVWINADGIDSGQGGGWFMYATKYYEMLLRGVCADKYEPMSWKPSATDVSQGGDNFGTTITKMEEWINFGVGNGTFEDDIFRYTFTLDRTRLELKDLESIGIGISFDAGGFFDYAIIPNRGGYVVTLNN